GDPGRVAGDGPAGQGRAAAGTRADRGAAGVGRPLRAELEALRQRADAAAGLTPRLTRRRSGRPTLPTPMVTRAASWRDSSRPRPASPAGRSERRRGG